MAFFHAGKRNSRALRPRDWDSRHWSCIFTTTGADTDGGAPGMLQNNIAMLYLELQDT